MPSVKATTKAHTRSQLKCACRRGLSLCLFSFCVLLLCFTFYVSCSFVSPQGSELCLAQSSPPPPMHRQGKCLAGGWRLQPPAPWLDGPESCEGSLHRPEILSHWVWLRAWKSAFVTRSPHESHASGLEGRVLCPSPWAGLSCSGNSTSTGLLSKCCLVLGSSCLQGLDIFMTGAWTP